MIQSPSRRPPRVLHTVAEAAEILRISRAKLYRLASAGQVPHRKIGSTGIKFSQEDIDAILEDAFRPAVVA